MNLRNIEVESKSLITQEKYFKLLYYFNDLFAFRGEENQLIYIYESDNDLRIEQANLFAKISFRDKKHKDKDRGNIEIKFNKDDFLLLHKLITKLGVDKKIEWHKKSMVFGFKNINIFLEHTKGFGYILRMQIITSEEFKDDAKKLIKDKFSEFEVSISSKKDFDARNYKYEANWQKFLKEK